MDQIFVGRRKTSVARVIVKPGNGKIVVNGRELDLAFPQKGHQDEITMPFSVTETSGQYDVKANVKGGGLTGQSQAIRLGISRFLSNTSEDFHSALKAKGLLTRDPRMVERKKYGRPKARKRFQFSKR